MMRTNGLRSVRNILVQWSKRLSNLQSTSYVHPSARVAKDLRLDRYVFVGPQCLISPNVTIGRYTMLASSVSIVGGDHEWTQPATPIQFSGRAEQKTTIIGQDVWVGHRVTIIRGVTIGDGSIISAGSVVTKDVPPRSVYGGVPARYIKDRFTSPSDIHNHRRMLDGPDQAPMYATRLTSSQSHEHQPS